MRVCIECGKEWWPVKGGPAARKPPTCDDHYLLYRKAAVLLSTAEYRAGKRGLSFDLDRQFIIDGLKRGCPKTGEAFVLSYAGSHYGNRVPASPSLDRIDPNKGYTKDNVQIVCWWYNVSKQQFTDEEVLKFCQKVTFHALAANPPMPTPFKTMVGANASDSAVEKVSHQV